MTKSVPAVLVLACAFPGFAQPNRPAFDTASIKPTNAKDNHSSWHSRPGYLVMNNQTLKALVGIAYGVPGDKGSRRSEVGRVGLMLMLQSTLSERFQLAVHRETKSISGFALVPAKNGLKIHPDETEGGSRSNGTRGKFIAQRISLDALAKSLTRIMGVPVADATDTKGVFTFTLEWAPESTPAAGTDGTFPDAPGPSLFTALQQELGLKLESKKVPTGMVVIDKAEKPTEN